MRTVAIGLDGCSWNVLEPLLATGQLPNLAQLADEGARGVLESSIPFYTGPAWASFATGASPAAHGVYDFLMLREDGRLTPASAGDLRRATYYHLLARAGRRSILVNLPLDQGASDGTVIVNSWLTVDEARRIFPLDRRERYRRALEAYRNYPTTFDASLETHLRDLCELEEARFALALALAGGEDWDHLFLLFSSTDWLGHMATGLFLDGDEAARAAFLRLYSQLDGYVGRIRETAPDALLVVLSDHGQCAETHVLHVNGLLHELGLVRQIRDVAGDSAAGGSGRSVRVPLALRHLRRSRLLRRAAGLAGAALRRGGVELVTPVRGLDVDRVRSRAFTPTVASYAIYTRDCGADELEAIRHGLAAVRLDDGRPALDGIWTLPELYGREPGPPAPTFVFAPALGVRPSIAVKSPFAQRARAHGRGAHQRDGIVLAAGPGVAGGDLGSPSLYDLCPTLLWFMGEPVPADADGRVLFEAFTDAAGSARELREVDATLLPGDHGPAHEAADAEVESRLRALGYL